MKLSFKIIFILMLCLTFMGCGVDRPPEDGEANDLIVVGFSQIGAESNWRVANTESIQAALSEENGFMLILDNARQQQENQLKAVRTFIQQGVDYIVLAPIVESGWESVLEEAKREGIPVIIVDRRVNVGNQGLYTTWVGANFRQEAETAVSWLEEELLSSGREDETVNILHVQGTLGGTAQIERSAGLEAAVERHSNWVIAAQLVGEYTQAKGYEVVLEYLKQNQDIDVLYCENDDMAFGAMEAMDELNIAYGAEGGVIVISFDAARTALEACMEGKINLCVECNPLHGPKVAELIWQMESGVLPPKEIFVEEGSFTTEMLTEEIIAGRAY
ncbi:MAG: ABC transporter substrate-binding protein [Clostridia bacterium]|nr:ABC transporter substrate-binding protein [Clostridia bacterium]